MNLIQTLRVMTVAALSLTALATGPAAAQAQAQASGKPLTFVVPFPPAAGTDLAARPVAEKLGARLSRPTVVENKPGAGGMLGAQQVARAPADGATLLLVPNTLVISPHVLAPGASGGLDVLKDLRPVVPVGTTPILLAANPAAAVRDLAGLRNAVRLKPGLAYGSAGNGSPMHFAGAMLQRAAGMDLMHVPYRGVAPSVIGALGGAGIELTGGTPQALAATVNADYERYGRIARELGIRAD